MSFGFIYFKCHYISRILVGDFVFHIHRQLTYLEKFDSFLLSLLLFILANLCFQVEIHKYYKHCFFLHLISRNV
jgi:hypothetical protein